MKKTVFTLSFSLVTLIASYSNLVFAQVTNSQNPTAQYQKNEVGSNENSSFGNGFNPLDFIHNANLRRSRDAGQFQEDTNSGLNQAANEFKRLQQQMMQSQPSESKGVPQN